MYVPRPVGYFHILPATTCRMSYLGQIALPFGTASVLGLARILKKSLAKRPTLLPACYQKGYRKTFQKRHE
jgi:hypothetical protein